MRSVSAVNPVIVIAQQEWALNLGSNARNLALEWSKTRPVLYVNPAMDHKSVWKQYRSAHGRQRLRLALGWGPATVAVAPNLWVHTPATLNYSINWLRWVALHQWLNWRNAVGFFRSLRRAISSLGWAEEACTVFNDSQMFTGLHLRELFRPHLSFYYIRDNLVEHPYFAFHGKRVEPDTIAAADAVFANSAYLADYARQYHLHSYDIGQGCELDLYDAQRNYPEPADLAPIPRPRLGYIGFLTGERLSIPLLETLAQENPQWSWVLIGPEEIQFQQSQLHQFANVYFLGARRPEDLPSYLHHLDVCLNPQSLNPLTVGNYPRKIDEYLAMGKPTVATATPAMNMFLPYVYLASDAASYRHAIEQALAPQSPAHTAAAIALAKGHTWAACLAKITAVETELSALAVSDPVAAWSTPS